MMASRRSSGCGRVYPRVDYTQAPLTVVTLGQPGQSIQHPHVEGGIDVSPAVQYFIRLFVDSSPCWQHSRNGIIICNNK